MPDIPSSQKPCSGRDPGAAGGTRGVRTHISLGARVPIITGGIIGNDRATAYGIAWVGGAWVGVFTVNVLADADPFLTVVIFGAGVGVVAQLLNREVLATDARGATIIGTGVVIVTVHG